jgi:hypothetical protein
MTSNATTNRQTRKAVPNIIILAIAMKIKIFTKV